jgi:hypothetical protein
LSPIRTLQNWNRWRHVKQTIDLHYDVIQVILWRRILDDQKKQRLPNQTQRQYCLTWQCVSFYLGLSGFRTVDPVRETKSLCFRQNRIGLTFFVACKWFRRHFEEIHWRYTIKHEKILPIHLEIMYFCAGFKKCGRTNDLKQKTRVLPLHGGSSDNTVNSSDAGKPTVYWIFYQALMANFT